MLRTISRPSAIMRQLRAVPAACSVCDAKLQPTAPLNPSFPKLRRSRGFATAPAADDDMEYEDYTSTSQVYDNTRVPIGMESLAEALLRAGEGVGKAVDELQLLDTGCGTGNYIHAVAPQVGACTGLEFNGGMLAQAREKLGDDPKVSLLEGSVLDIPYPDESFDVVRAQARSLGCLLGGLRPPGFPGPFLLSGRPGAALEASPEVRRPAQMVYGKERRR